MDFTSPGRGNLPQGPPLPGSMPRLAASDRLRRCPETGRWLSTEEHVVRDVIWLFKLMLELLGFHPRYSLEDVTSATLALRLRHAVAVFRTKILHAYYGFDSIRMLFSRGEMPQSTGNSPGTSTRRILVCETSV